VVPETNCRDKDGIAFHVREYQPQDRPALERFYDAFVPKRAAQGLPPADPPRIRRWLDGVLVSGIHHLAFRDGELIGHAFVLSTQRDGIGEYAVFLREDRRGRGLGTELNRTVVDAARNRGLDGLWLTVEPWNRAAIRSYEKVGFRFVPGTLFGTELEMELLLR
jgi:RimJ/RimL family protein N-acetyltransferase